MCKSFNGLAAADPTAFERIGEEVTELLDITPAKFFKRRIIRRKECRWPSAHI